MIAPPLAGEWIVLSAPWFMLEGIVSWVEAIALFQPRLQIGVATGIMGLRQLHSGHIGDYVTWLVLGISILGTLLAKLSALAT